MTKRGIALAAGLGVTVLMAFGVKKMFMSPRDKIIGAALRELGEQNPDKYWSVVQPGLVGSGAAWCGGFALWVLKEAGLAGDLDWEIGKGFIFKGAGGRALSQTKEPQPGDIAYFAEPFQHHAIVKSFDGETLETIDGNQGPGEQVKVRTRNPKEATAFYSIEPLIAIV